MIQPLLLVILVLASFGVEAKELTIYSSRKEPLIQPIIEAYQKETGTKIVLETGSDSALIERIKAEGKKTPADILMTVDAGNLWQAENLGLLVPLQSETLAKNIPSSFRDPESHWYAFSVRARTVFYNPKKVKASELSTYEDLADNKWKERLCLRTSQKVYNQSLVASLIAHHGKEKAESVVKGWVSNLATPVFSDDTSLLKAIDAGQCDVGIANTYYFGRMLKDKKDWNIAVFWPNQKTFGTHVNVSGAGVVKGSKNQAAAQKFLEWLSLHKAQKLFAALNLEYPVNAAIDQDPLIQSWGSFKRDLLVVKKLGELQSDAVKVMDRAKYR